MKNFIALLMLALVPFGVGATVCGTYCPGAQATATTDNYPGATYQWTVTGPEVLTILGQGTPSITIPNVGLTAGQYSLTIQILDPLGCSSDSTCYFDVINATGTATFANLCSQSGPTDLNSLATLAPNVPATFSWIDPGSGQTVNGPLLDPAAFPPGNVTVAVTLQVNGCTITVNGVINLTSPPANPPIQMG